MQKNLLPLVKEEINNTTEKKYEYLTKDIANLRDDLFNHFATKDFVGSKILESEAKLEAKISEAKFQIILWAFVFWVTQLGAIFAFLKFIK